MGLDAPAARPVAPPLTDDEYRAGHSVNGRYAVRVWLQRRTTWGIRRRPRPYNLYHETSPMEPLVNGESGYVQAWRRKDITLNIC